jgi:hypothetical protein
MEWVSNLVGRDFQIEWKCPKGTSPSTAFNDMCTYMHDAGRFEFANVLSRGFKPLLRDASERVDVFVKRKIKMCDLEGPTFCLPIRRGFLFFGKYGLKMKYS